MRSSVTKLRAALALLAKLEALEVGSTTGDQLLGWWINYWVGGLGFKDTPKNPNPFHFRGS